MRRLIVNADDFGLSPGLTEGALRAHAGGIVTSVSVMTATSLWERTVQSLARYPALDLGVHLTMCEGAPVSVPGDIPTIVGGDGLFPSSLSRVLRALLQKSIRLDDVRTEWRAQIQRAVDAGWTVTHVDSHKHLHLMPALFAIVCELRDEFHIPAVRIPYEPGSGPRRLMRAGLNVLAQRARRRLHHTGGLATDVVAGIAVSGRLTTRELARILRALPEGTTELITHPGVEGDEVEALSRVNLAWMSQYQFAAEVAALTAHATRELVDELGIELTTFGALATP